MFFKKKQISGMEREIFEQADILEHILDVSTDNNSILLDVPTDIAKVVLVASGSSYNCARYIADLFGNIADMEARAIYSSEFLLKSAVPHDNNILYVFITQSGETTDTNKALVRAKEYEVRTLCVTNKKDSTIWQASDYKIECHAGEERSIAATKSLTAQMLCLTLLVLKYASLKGVNTDDYLQNLKKLPDYIRKTYNNREQIKKVAHSKNYIQILLLIILIVLFALTLFCSCFYIGKYYEAKNKVKGNAELIEISKKSNKSLITNNGPFERVIDDTLSEDVLIESYANVELSTNDDSENDGVLVYDVKYEIIQNDFTFNPISNISSDILVRFSYSFDNKEWKSTDYVLTAPSTTLNPLMSNYYDIGGIVGAINVSTNYKLSSKPGETKKMYWKSETLIRNTGNTVGKAFKANLKIEYKESA